ncbi:MAG: four helix bundle protein [Caldilineales bacterium]
MTRLAYAMSYRELIVYQKARELSRELFHFSKSFPREEMYSLTDQLRRSSRSVGGQIAEAWAKRRYERHFVSKLTDADGEQQETQHWIDTALDCEYLSPQQRDEFIGKCEEIGRLLGGMIAKADRFCGAPTPQLRESAVEYLVEDDLANFYVNPIKSTSGSND